jgi:hypothetical protein
MRHVAILAILSVLSLSMCTGMPDMDFFGGNVSEAGFTTIESGSQNLFMAVEVVPSQVKSGRSVTLRFSIQNNNPYDIEDVSISVYDMCVFTGESSKDLGDIKANRSAEETIKLESSEIDLDRQCDIKFMISYNAQQVFTQDFAVLSASEYEQMELAGTIGTIPVSSFSQSGPLTVTMRLSDEQPLVDGEEYYLYIDYYSSGEGVIEVGSGDIAIHKPSSISDFECDDYYSSSLKISKSLSFVSGRAQNSVCSFTAESSSPMTIGTMTVTADYSYKVYGSVPILVERD